MNLNFGVKLNQVFSDGQCHSGQVELTFLKESREPDSLQANKDTFLTTNINVLWINPKLV